MKKEYFVILIGCLLSVMACTKRQPYVYRGLPSEYEIAYEEIYGHCYDSVPYAVVALDLYSDSITLDENHKIKGSGYNLYLSDIFVPDSLLEEGTYKSDTTAQPFTFLPGRDYEGLPHGLYLLKIEEDHIASIQVLDSGSFVYRNDSLLFTLYYRNSYGSRARYTCSFQGPLIPWQKQ